MQQVFVRRSDRMRRILMTGLFGFATLLVHGCGDSGPATKSGPTEIPPEQAKANNAMMDFVKSKKAEKK